MQSISLPDSAANNFLTRNLANQPKMDACVYLCAPLVDQRLETECHGVCWVIHVEKPGPALRTNRVINRRICAPFGHESRHKSTNVCNVWAVSCAFGNSEFDACLSRR